ncbi:MAG: DUF3168 domain-containing protein [Proteobacteria bacterium]|nr:DUF3168 domain-containing protein [Pseudomonadota bacterium]
MPSASWSLQKAVYAALAADAAVASFVADRLFDAVPQRRSFPYVTLGQSTVRDWSTGSDEGDEHQLTLHVWSRADGRREAHELMSALKLALHERTLSLEGHHLVNLRHELSEARREPDGETYHGIVRLRAVTEPI